MTNRSRIYRTTTFGNRPGVGAQPYGVPYVNFADKQFGVMDSTQTPQDLIGVPYFSALANYNAGQPVNYQGQTYIAQSTVVAGPWNAIQWSPIASQSWVEGQGGPGGAYVNKIRNPKMSVWQRGSPINTPLSSSAFGADGWMCGNLGSTSTITRVQGRATQSAMQIQGNTGNTSLFYRTHMEASETYPLGGNSVTFQAQLMNRTGNPLTPSVSLYHPTSTANNFSANTIDFTTTLQTCPNNVWTRVGCTWNVPLASSSMGLGIDLYLGPITSSAQTVAISEVDLRATPGLATGLIANPPQPELRPDWVEFVNCTRYYWNMATVQQNLYAPAASVVFTPALWFFPCGFMFATPTIGFSVYSSSNASSITVTSNSPANAYPSFVSIAAGMTTVQFNFVTFTAEL